ncbi:winged helix-turn-helix domain-containing protein [Candidatus Acetothermia bacterium]|nr:winged helix-turn-helix domain-containing protein [Candidatus Acetothermia bacterium]
MTELQKAVYEILQSSPVPMQVKDLYATIKIKAPHLCDDSVPCSCGQKHPLWQHLTAWALQYLKHKKLAHSTRRGFWEVTTKVVVEPTPSPIVSEKSLHGSLKTKIRELGEILGRYAKEEYPAPPYIYDVIWKDVEGMPRASHVFEVQDKGLVSVALAKLQHAHDIWKSRLFLVVTGEKDRVKVGSLLEPFLEGTFHRIRKDTTLLTPEIIDEIYRALSTHKEIIRYMLEL